MFGRSLYLSSTNEEIALVTSKLKQGEWCFISLHTPEDITDDMSNKALALVNAIHHAGAKIIADVSPRGVKALGCNSLEELAYSGTLDALRCDYGYTTQEMLEAHTCCPIVLNASCTNEEELQRFIATGRAVMAMHNFYPRPETALDEEECLKQNNFIRENGAESLAFISGLKSPRGPIFEGLPTVEKYRRLPSYVQYVLLRFKLKTDHVFLGDLQMDENSETFIKQTEKEDMLVIPIKTKDCFPQEFLNRTLNIRTDSNSYLARIVESREYSALGKPTSPCCNNTPRKAGSITMDNDAYGRYSGELMVVRKDLQPDERVNVIAEIPEDYLTLLELCVGGRKIQFAPIQ